MDSSITLSYGSKTTSTRISNNFIDNYMTDARGSDVKVYIYLLRCYQDPTMLVNISAIAEALDETEKDVRTALKYWDKQHVLSVSSTRGKITNITLHDVDETDETEDEGEAELPSDEPLMLVSSSGKNSTSSVASKRSSAISGISELPGGAKASRTAKSPKTSSDASESSRVKAAAHDDEKSDTAVTRPNYNNRAISSLRRTTEFDSLLDYVEEALGRTLTEKNLQTPCFLFDGLDFSPELIRFLYDYCIENSKKNNPESSSTKNIESYVETIAMQWHSAGITTIEAAKAQIEAFSSRYNTAKPAAEKKKNMMQQFAQRSYSQQDFDDLEKRKLNVQIN